MVKRTAYVLLCMIFLSACGKNAGPTSSLAISNPTPFPPTSATITLPLPFTSPTTQSNPTLYSYDTPDFPNTEVPSISSGPIGLYILLSDGEGSYSLVSLEGEIARVIERNSGTEVIVLNRNTIEMAGRRLVIGSLENDEIALGPVIDCTGSWSVISIQDDYLISCEFETQLNFYNSTGELILVHPDPGLGDIYFSRQAFSPDGRYLAIWYSTIEFGQNPDSGLIISDVECLFRNDSGNCTSGPYLRSADPGYITWSPTSRKLAVSPDGGNNGEITILDLDTGESKQILQLFTKIRGLQWSPTGEFIAYSKVYSSDNGIYLIEPQESEPSLLIETPNNYYSVIGWVDFRQQP